MSTELENSLKFSAQNELEKGDFLTDKLLVGIYRPQHVPLNCILISEVKKEKEGQSPSDKLSFS